MVDADVPMHIPDGYLSPGTCAGLYAAAAPFWYVSLRRIERELSTRTIPLLSVFAAFSFVIMMFNLPLPGGTTGHAVGMGIAAIILGPWVSILAISIALLIQALFFGDGGVTTFGANCFNMAIVGSLVAFAVYRAIGRGAAITSRRRVVAAGFAGYAAINVAAFCAAVEFGIQPLFFHDVSGSPLYAPYPLSVAVPAMMIGHMTFAGFAELILSAGVIAYFQRADPELLRRTAPDAPRLAAPAIVADPCSPGLMARRLWLGVALLLILTPLGILAVGRAWGEWSAKDFSNPASRREIALSSGNHLPPTHVPAGLARLSSIWKAPISGYAPSFFHSSSFGYFVSAMAGVGLIILLSLGVSRLIAGKLGEHIHAGRRRRSFIETTIQSLLRAAQEALFAEDVARSKGFLQSLDPRTKLVGIGALIVAAIAVHRISMLVALFGCIVLLAAASHVSLRLLAARIWIAVLVFTGAIALPAIVLIPGQAIAHIPLLEWPVTSQGLRSAVLLIMRAETAATLSFLLITCTFWNRLLRALRFFRVPAVLVVIAGMTYRYIFLLVQTAQNMFEARQTRLIGYLQPAEQRRFAGASAGVLLGKSLQLSVAVHTAMEARGFRGEIELLDDLRMKGRDWLQAAAFVSLACAATWFGR